MADAPSLTAELLTRLLRRLLVEWETFNQRFFHGAMKRPQMMLGAGDFLGRWNLRGRSITLQQQMVLEQPWGVVLEVLKHEMAHQYVDEVLRAQEPPHGPAFRGVCERLGLDASAAGLPGVPSAPDEGEARVLRRITRLLALAGSSNTHEAEQAARAAQRLLALHNIDQIQARDLQRGDADLQRGSGGYRFCTVGPVKSRHDTWEQILGSILNTFFFVRCIWVPIYRPLEGEAGTALELCGTGTNLEIAGYVHAFLVAGGERAWEAYKAAEGIRGNTERRRFLAGLMLGFHQKLEQEQAQQQEEGLIRVGDSRLERYMDTRHPSVRSRRSGSTLETEAFTGGVEAGRRIVLRQAMEEDGGYRGRLITGAPDRQETE